MVDPTKGVGQLPGISPLSKPETQKTQKINEEVSRKDETPKDEVVLSKEALSLADAEKTAKKVREDLEKSEFSLSLNPNFDEKI